MKVTRPVLEIFKMDGYFPDSPRIYPHFGENYWLSLWMYSSYSRIQHRAEENCRKLIVGTIKLLCFVFQFLYYYYSLIIEIILR